MPELPHSVGQLTIQNWACLPDALAPARHGRGFGFQLLSVKSCLIGVGNP